LAGDAELADQKNIERRDERFGDFRGDRNAASWKRKNEDIRPVCKLLQSGRQMLSGLLSVPEWSHE
jgi:hypothetical protein